MQEVNAGGRKSINQNSAGDPSIVQPAAAAPPRRPEPVEQHRAGRNHISQPQFRRARFFGTHAPRDQENQPEMPERKHARAPDAVLARPLSLASYPVATGRPLPGHQRPRARVRVMQEVNAGAGYLARPLSLASYPVATGRPLPGHQRPRARVRVRKHASPDAVLARPLSLASYPVATGRPLPGHQRPRARVRVMQEVNAGGNGGDDRSAVGTGRHNPASKVCPCLKCACREPARVRYSAPRGIGVAAYTHMCTGVSGNRSPSNRSTRMNELGRAKFVRAR